MQSTRRDMNKNKIFIITLSFYFSFMVFGFPIQSAISLLLGVDSNPINIGFRILFLALSIFIILINLLVTQQKTIKIGWLLFTLFWLMYSLRLIYNIEIEKLAYLNTDAFFVYSFAFGVCLIPSIAIYGSAKYIDYISTIKLSFWIILLSNLCIAYSILSFGNWNLSEILLSRAAVKVKIGGQEKSIVNEITIGFFGQVLAILSIHFLNFPIYKNTKFKYFLYICLIIGLLNLLMGASRGPMLFFVILFLIELYLVIKNTNNLRLLLIKIAIFSFLTISFSVPIIVQKIESGEIALINRLFFTAEIQLNDKKEEREYLIESAIRQFKESPIIGDAYVTRHFYLFNSYSHNLLLDVLMATGILGALIFGGMLFFIFSKLKWIVKNIKSQPIYSSYLILFISIFLMTMTSGGLFMSSGFWIMGALILGHFNNQYAYS